MQKQNEEFGTLHSLFIKTEHGAPMQPVSKLIAISGKGLQGDQAYGRRSRQVLLVDLNQVRNLKLDPGDLRENITVAGLAIDSLPVGSQLKSGEVILEIVDVCDPCNKLEDIRPGLMQASEDMRGMLAVVKSSGTLHRGEWINLLA